MVLIGTNYKIMSHIAKAKEKIVRNASDLSGTLLSDVVYIIDGVIDMGSQSITVPLDGLNIKGLGFGVSKLISSQSSYTLFIDGGATRSGNLFIQNLEIEVTGTNSQVFDIDNQGNSKAIEMNDVNFNDCTSLGEIANYRQVLETERNIWQMRSL